MRYPDSVSEFVFASWEGSAWYGKDILGVPSYTVRRCEISDGGKTGSLRVQW